MGTMTDVMTIRKYEPRDKQECIDIFNSNCPEFFDPGEIELLEKWLTAQDKGQHVYDTSVAEQYYVLEYNNRIIASGGFVILKDKPIAVMAWGMVLNGYHRQGFGKKLFVFRAEEIRKQYPNYSITLDTSQHSYKFFKHLGFVVTKITPEGYGPGLDRYDMVQTAELG
jgi:[ribosomal protein S18]-alanine N-acetyltransferase